MAKETSIGVGKMRQALPPASSRLLVSHVNLPGVVLSSAIAVTSASLASLYGAPVMSLGLLVGMAFDFLTAEAGS